MRGTLIISLTLALLAVIFALQNAETIEVQVGPWVFVGSTALVLLATFILGVVVGILATVPVRFQNRLQLWKLKKTIKKHDLPLPGTVPTPAPVSPPVAPLPEDTYAPLPPRSPGDLPEAPPEHDPRTL